MFSASSFAQAQEVEKPKAYQQKHELSLWGAYGLSSLYYDLSFGERTLGLGYIGGLGYNYFFNYHWSIGIGAEFSALTASSDVSNLKDNYIIPGFLGIEKPLNLEINTANYEQDYNAYYINIPVMAKYQLDVWKQHKFYVAGGAKVGIPFKGEYTSKGSFSAKGFERTINGENTGSAYTIDKYGFGNRSANLDDGEFDLDINVMLALEAGMKWRLSNKLSLYTGLFVDYGLVDVRKEDASLDLLQYNVNERSVFSGYTFNNVLDSRHTEKVNGETRAFTDKVNTISAGIKVQLAFGVGSLINKPVKKSEVVTSSSKPEKHLTAGEVDEIVARNTQYLIDAQKGEFKDIKDILNKFFIKEAKEEKEGYRLKTVIGFDLDKTTILPSMHSVLNENLATLKENPGIYVNLIGNTDDIGNQSYNYNLGLKRANAVRDWLISQGINGNRLNVSSNGDQNPAIPNVDDANRQYNRRVEFIIQK